MKMLQTIRNSRLTKTIAMTLAILILEPATNYKSLMASAGGPTQPEYSGFTAVSAQNLVDPFTGNVGYAVPLFEIGGYPVTISYSGDIGMEQDAGWVGLGWSLNVGSINRGLRGVPDEFNGTDKVNKWEKQRPHEIVKIEGNQTKIESSVLQQSPGLKDSSGKTQTASVSQSFDNYTGYGFGFSVSSPRIDKFLLSRPKEFDTINISVLNDKITSKYLDDELFSYKSIAVMNAWNTIARTSSSEQLDFSYDSKSGVSTDINLSGLSHKLINEKSLLWQVGIPGSVSANSRSGKIELGTITGLGSLAYSGYQTYFAYNPVCVEPPSPMYKYQGVRQFDLSKPAGTNATRNFSVKVTRTITGLKHEYMEFPAYGYLNMRQNPMVSESRQTERFPRITDVQEMPKYIDAHTTELPTSAVLSDIFNISGAGIGGAFRLHDNELIIHGPAEQRIVPTVNSTYVKGELGNTAASNEIGLDLGFVVHTEKYSPLSKEDFAGKQFIFGTARDTSNSPFQKVSFNNDFEFIESSVPYHGSFGWDSLSWLNLLPKKNDRLQSRFTNDLMLVKNLKNQLFTLKPITKSIRKERRDARQQVISFFTGSEAAVHGIYPKIRNYQFDASGNPELVQNSYAEHLLYKTEIDRSSANGPRKGHHISEFTVLQPDGSRYYYGTPVYNYAEYEYQFNVTHDLLTSDIHPNRTKNNYDYHTGLSTYTSQDIENNTKGITHHAATKRIPAYASTYLLNAVLSGDYVDITGDGPSEDDLGNYVQMNYGMLYGSETNAASFEASGYKWRNLMDANKADLSLGNKSDRQDDQASFSYGSKEIWYLHSIESKDQVALFYLKRRLDAAEVQSRDGGVSANGVRFLYCLDKVEVYARQEFKKNGTGAEPLKVIHFQYSYDLCRNFTGNIAFYDNSLAAKNPMGLPHPLTGNTADFNRGGKLTLHKIWVTYGKQDIPTSAPYVFEYNTPNPNYSYHAVDRWGVYKPHSAGYNNINAISNTDFPYTLQNKDSADMRSQCWMLSDISLPSGGKINIEYESDSYGFVQDKEAMQMLQVKAITDEAVYDYSNPDNRLLYINNQVIPFAKAKRRYLIVKKPAGVSQMSELVDEDEMLHYAFMVQMGRSGLSESDSTYEEVNGFCEIEQVGDVNNTYGFIKLKAELAGM